MSTAVATILEWSSLAIARRTSLLSIDAKKRTEELEIYLRNELIDGARPVATQIANPAPAQPSKATTIGNLAQELPLTAEDKGKLNSVRTEDIPVSSYTPSKAPPYLTDWYDESVAAPSASVPANEAPTTVMRAGGEAEKVELPKELRVLLGMQQDVPRAAIARITARPPTAQQQAQKPTSSPAAKGATSTRRPAIIHLMAGGTRRGSLDGFDPSRGALALHDEKGAVTQIELPLVLAIFFGLHRGEEPTPPTGTKMIVKLINDRDVAGVSTDYAEGAESLTLVPEQKRGNVERVWIPAWAVQQIQLV